MVVGCAVGVVVGCAVGVDVGCAVGVDVGCGVGVLVGVMVGVGVFDTQAPIAVTLPVPSTVYTTPPPE